MNGVTFPYWLRCNSSKEGVLRGKVSSFRFQGWAVHSACRRRRKRRWLSPGGQVGQSHIADSAFGLAYRLDHGSGGGHGQAAAHVVLVLQGAFFENS